MRLTWELSLLRLTSILYKSPVISVQRISVAWIVVRLPSYTTLDLTRSSIELTFASPIGQPKEKPGFSKPFLVPQPVASAATSSAMIVHVRFILRSPSCGAAAPTFPACDQLTLPVRRGHRLPAAPGTAQKAHCAAGVSLPRYSVQPASVAHCARLPVSGA